MMGPRLTVEQRRALAMLATAGRNGAPAGAAKRARLRRKLDSRAGEPRSGDSHGRKGSGRRKAARGRQGAHYRGGAGGARGRRLISVKGASSQIISFVSDIAFMAVSDRDAPRSDAAHVPSMQYFERPVG